MAFKSVILDGRFWAAAAERAVFTGAQVFVATLSVFSATDVANSNIVGLPWSSILSVTFFAMLLAFVTSVAKAGIGPQGPGLVEELPPKREPQGGRDGLTGL